MISSQRDESGMTTIAYILATGLSLIVVTWCAMFIIASYTRAAIRGASERATRSGVVAHSVSRNSTYAIDECERVYENDMNEALPGNMRHHIHAQCVIVAGKIEVRATGDLSSLGPMLVGGTINETTSRRLEVLP